MKILLIIVGIVLASCSLSTAAPHKSGFSAMKNINPAAHSHQHAASRFFQLQAQSNNLCLSLTASEGIYVPCTAQKPTIYFLSWDPPITGANSIVIFGTSQCLDREHCHSSTSNLRYSDCDHCGAIHWDIRSDGSLSEDNGNNCIYSVSNTTAAIRHCQDGYERFRPLPYGNSFLMRSVQHGDCVNGGSFVNCSSAPTYYITGTPHFYNIRVYSKENTCLDREHCHSSTSDLRFSDCSHCGAIHWSIEGSEVGEDNMNNCINRNNNVAYVKHCSDDHEELQYEFVPLLTSEALQTKKTSTLTKYFPNPDISNYLTLNLTQRCRGVKIFRNHMSQSSTIEIEVVHFLPDNQTFNVEQYYIQYIVTYIHTNIPYKKYNGLTSKNILEEVSTDLSRVTDIDFRYGGVRGPIHNNHDSLFSEFLTNSGPGAGEPLPQRYYPKVVSEIYYGFRRATNNWTLYRDSMYQGSGSIAASPQIFLSILPREYHSALYYWSYSKTDGHHL